MSRRQALIALAAAVVAFLAITAVSPISLTAIALLVAICALMYVRYRRKNLATEGEPGAEQLGRDNRHIPQAVKVQVAARDRGKCVICGSRTDLQFDHIIPWSRGGSSKDPGNIQLLCGTHNREKSDKLDYTG